MGTKRDSGSTSPWQVSATAPNHTKGQTTAPFDVLIIGGGITGITTALLLQKQGKKCLIVEGGNLGFGTTGGTTAHINTFFDSSYPQIKSDFGEENAKLVAQAAKSAIATITSLTEELQIDCQLETKIGYLYSENEDQTKELQKILNASKEAGVAVSAAEENGVPIPFEECVAFAGQKQFHPLKYSFGLAQEFLALGGKISEHSFITSVEMEDDIHIARTGTEEFRAKNLVYATHLPPGINLFSFRCAPYRSYVLGVKLSAGAAYPEDMAYDMQDAYHYMRSHEIDGERLLIIGGADHKTGHDDPEKAYQDLEDYTRKYFKVQAIPYRWSSQYYVPVDGLPYIGPMTNNDDTTFVATGFNGNGMTWGTVSGMVISDAILGKENPYAELFKPYRIKPIAGFTDFVKENADVVYHFVADRFNLENVDTLSALAKGDGKVVEFEGEKIAVYRDESGKISALNPTCTHAGCTVCFNPAEKSWDCPCHGGRFDLSGKVICGPPRKDLEAVNLGNDEKQN